MSEHGKRTRRSDRYAQTPERVSEAARQAVPSRTGMGIPPQQTDWNRSQEEYGQAARMQQTGWEGRQDGQWEQDAWTQQQYEQFQYQQEMARLQYEAQQEYARQQYAYQQEQTWRIQQQEEKKRVSSETSSHGAFRGYTGEMPNLGQKKPAPPQTPKKKSKAGLVLGLLLLAGVLITGSVLGIRNYQERKAIHDAVSAYDNLFAEGVYVDGIHLGGMTPEQGLNSVQSQIQERNAAWHVTLTWQGTQLAQINAGMLGMSVDVGQIMNEAWAQGHTGDEDARYAAMLALKESPYQTYTAIPSGDTSVIDNVLTQVKSQIDKQAVNARLLEFDPTKSYPFSFQEESEGCVLNIEEVREELYHMVATMTSGNVELQPETVKPNTRLADLQKHYMLRSSVYTTIATSSTDDRNNNIRRSLELINGYVLGSGSQFSFNGVVGERTEANGFFPAIEYAYGEHVMGIGGGVCQASTTVYQAAVCAGLSIIKREPHSDAVNYTEYGKDATVYWLGKRKIDLVFKNNTEDPIYIVAGVQKDPSNKRRLIAKVMMYGADMGDVRYEIDCKTVQELDPPEKPTYVKDKEGTYVKYTDQEKSVSKAKPGYVVESYRVRYEGNAETERALLYVDTYEPKPERIYVGVTKRGEN